MAENRVAENRAADFLRRLAAIDVNHEHFVNRFKQFIAAVLSATVDIFERHISLGFAEVTCRTRLETLRNSLDRAVEAAYVYAEHVGDLNWYGGNAERIQNIRGGIERDDFAPLTGFIQHLLTVYLVKAENSCEAAERAFEDVRSSALNLAADCRRHEREAKTKKTVARAFGGTAVAAAGVVTLAVAGACTLGIGTIVGVGVAALSSAAAGTGAGIASYTFSSDYATSERGFSELSRSFDCVRSSASSMFDYTRTVKMYLELLADKAAIVNQTREAHEVRSCLLSAFDLLCQRFDGPDPSTHREELKAMNEDFQARISEILG